ncbi:hypothetical protein [Parapedobacter sp. 10938]|uniref:hypothetical protein n=1 Tax=Parapedobacter flavus TaxID=3110225 RepID=UPI002DBF6EF8|nr:hypothetical protein [Parapedobacter sp. 10938]MEC3881220.1 hypothetical protein [Parapedobacter sp. 10938]
MITKLLIAFALFGSMLTGFWGYSDPGLANKEDKTSITGYFEGTEPFWNMTVEENRIVLHCVNDIVRDTLLLSRKQTHTETYAFHGRAIHGIVRRSETGGCTLDITGEDNPTHDIYFAYRNVTYMGCGKLSIRSK